MAAESSTSGVIYTYTKTSFDGGHSVLSISDCTKAEADAMALRLGWKPPRWWQWWRRHDRPRRRDLSQEAING